MWKAIPIILLIMIVLAYTQYVFLIIAFALLIYSIVKKKKVMCMLFCVLFAYTIHLCIIWDDLVADTNKERAIREEQRMKEEEAKKEEWQRANREEDERRKKEKEEKYGIEISEEDLKAKLEPLIPQEYKGSRYELEVSKGGGRMLVDLSLQNEKFKDLGECKKFIKEIVNEVKKFKIDTVYFDFYSKDDGGILNHFRIQDFSKIRNNVDEVENIYFREEEVETKEEEKLRQEKNNDNNYIRNSGIDPLDRIKKLKELLDSGAITQEEYNKKKKVLLE
ncbi:SHOCT domain-containing protein [Clostridioides difficile]|nr:SHOCT domain-containing protein [Clostridioides difficile]